MSLRVQKVSEPKVSGTSSPASLGTWCFSPQTLSWQWGNQLVNSFALRNLSCPEVSPPSGQIRGWRSGRGGLHFKGETKEDRHNEVSVMWKNTGREFVNSAQVGIIQLLYQSFRRCLGCQGLCHLKQNQPWNLFSSSHVTAMHKWYSCFLLLFDESPPKCSGLKQPQSFNYYFSWFWGLTGFIPMVPAQRLSFGCNWTAPGTGAISGFLTHMHVWQLVLADRWDLNLASTSTCGLPKWPGFLHSMQAVSKEKRYKLHGLLWPSFRSYQVPLLPYSIGWSGTSLPAFKEKGHRPHLSVGWMSRLHCKNSM